MYILGFKIYLLEIWGGAPNCSGIYGKGIQMQRITMSNFMYWNLWMTLAKEKKCCLGNNEAREAGWLFPRQPLYPSFPKAIHTLHYRSTHLWFGAFQNLHICMYLNLFRNCFSIGICLCWCMTIINHTFINVLLIFFNKIYTIEKCVPHSSWYYFLYSMFYC